MSTCMSTMLALWEDESGQDMAEYALLLVLLGIVVASAALVVFGGAITNQFNKASGDLKAAAG